MKSLFRICVVVAVALLVSSTACDVSETARPQVTAADFEIVSCNSRWSRIEMLHAFGEVRNNGTVGASPEIELIARDAKGRLVDTATIWPANPTNIPPGGARSFTYPLTRDKNAVTVSSRVVSVHVWK